MNLTTYDSVLRCVREFGQESEDRTGVGTLSLFGVTYRHSLANGFPAVTTKRLFFRGVVEELCWFLRGSSDVRELHEKNVHIWDEWMKPDGTIGPGYGTMWRSFPAPDGKNVDQISNLVEAIRKTPDSRRLLVSAWHPALVGEQALPPCHYAFQVYVRNGKLSLMWQQRSADVFLGLPFNIAEYAVLAHLLARLTGYEVGDLIGNLGDTHVYLNHLEQADLQLSRAPMPLPTIELSDRIDKDFDLRCLCAEDVRLVGYKHHPHIEAPVAV